MSKISELSDGGVIQGGDTLIAVRSGGNVKVTYGGSTTANIDGGTIDGTVIGGSSAAAGTFTTLTASGEITANGGIALGDNDKATFGASDDLQIFHDGSDSYVKDVGAGNLYIDSSDTIIRANGTENSAKFIGNGRVELYYDAVKKFETTSTGIDVTGTVTADGLTVENGATSAYGDATFNHPSSSSGLGYKLYLSGLNSPTIRGTIIEAEKLAGSAHNLNFYTNASGASPIKHLSVGSTGDISFYSSDGLSQALFWDASTERLGLGTTAPAPQSGGEGIHINGSTYAELKFTNSTTGGTSTDGTSFVSSGVNFLINNREAGEIQFNTSNAERMVIDSAGNLLVGKTSTSGGIVGSVIASSGLVRLTADGIAVAEINRLTSDGSIVDFKKNGTTVGSIGYNIGALTVDGAASRSGLYFGNGAILPRYDGSLTNGTNADLGTSSQRFENLYLSGNATHGTTPSSSAAGAFTEAFGRTTYSRGSGTGGFGHLIFINGNGTVGTVTTSGSATAYNTSSDYRLKENVVAMSGATERLKQLKPSRFNFITDADTTVDGFLAHEVQDVVPEAISGTKDAMRDEEYEVTPAVLDDDGNVVTEAVMGTRSVPDYQGIDQSKLVPLLVATIQELEARITQLENN